MACRCVRFSYRLLPLPAWRAFLLARHMDHCPSCQGAALDDAAIRSLGITPSGLGNEPPLPPLAAVLRAAPRRRHFRLSYAYGLILAVIALGAVVVVSRLVPPAYPPQGIVTVMEDEEDPRVFAVLAARIGDSSAQPVILKAHQPGLTIVWFEKNIH